MQLELPNGQFVEVDDNISEEEKQKIINTIKKRTKKQLNYGTKKRIKF